MTLALAPQTVGIYIILHRSNPYLVDSNTKQQQNTNFLHQKQSYFKPNKKQQNLVCVTFI